MKTKNQARHNHGTKSPSPQVKTPVVPGFAPHTTDINQICLAIYNRATQRPVEKIPLTEEELELLFSLRGHDECGNLVAEVLRHYMVGLESGGVSGEYTFLMPKSKTPNPLCLCIYDRKYQEPVVLVPISECEFELLEADEAATEDVTVASSIVAIAVRALLKIMVKEYRLKQAQAAMHDPSTFTVLTELELAKNQSNTLLAMMIETWAIQHRKNLWTEDQAFTMLAGLQEMVNSTQARLSAAFNATRAATTPRPQTGGAQ
jgi:hypothetical protein